MTKIPIRWRAAEIYAARIGMKCEKCKAEVPCWIDQDGKVEVVR